MYNRYMFGSFSPVIHPHPPREKNSASNSINEKPFKKGIQDSLSSLLSGLNPQKLLGRFDPGDILLVLIILFLCYEGDNLELVITLGLILLFGLEDPQFTP